VTFAYLNLVADSYPLPLNNPQGAFGSATNMDLILCRNVLIYFNQETTRNVVGRLYDSLADGGWLIVGHAEPSQEVFRAFVTRNFPDTVVYQKRQTNVQPLSVDAPPMSLLPALCPLPAVCVAPVKANVQPMSPPGNGNRYHKGAAQSSFQMPLSATTPRPAAAFVAPTGRPANGQGQPEDSQSSYRAAKLHANRLQLDAAEAQIKIALERAPLMAPAHHLHGMILAEQGRLDEALAALRRCIYADSQFVLGQYALADLLARMGQAGRAEKVRETVRRLLDRYRPDDPIPEGDGLTAGQLLEMLKTHNSFGTDPGPQPAYSET
jgi:chemotaxis protein methyltransferase CheR